MVSIIIEILYLIAGAIIDLHLVMSLGIIIMAAYYWNGVRLGEWEKPADDPKLRSKYLAICIVLIIWMVPINQISYTPGSYFAKTGIKYFVGAQ